MPEYYRVKVDGTEAYIIDEENNPLPPDECHTIGNKLIQTAGRPMYVYLGRNHTGHWKIGYTSDPDRRAKELKILNFYEAQCHSWGEFSAQNVEAALHTIYRLVGKHVEGEWFRLTRYDVQFIRQEIRSQWFPDPPPAKLIVYLAQCWQSPILFFIHRSPSLNNISNLKCRFTNWRNIVTMRKGAKR